MNQFFYESRGKEKINEFLKEGQGSQAFRSSGARKLDLLGGLPKLILVVLGIIGILGLLGH